VYTEAFASALKDAASSLYRIPRWKFDDTSAKEKKLKYWGLSPREIAQTFGTEIIRHNLGKNHWVRVMHGKLTGQHFNEEADGAYVDSDTVILTDVRFDNEAMWILSNGGFLIHVTREGAEGQVGVPDHASEAGISSNVFEAHSPRIYKIVNNGTIEELEAYVKDFVKLMYLEGRLIPKDVTSTEN
jgi:hypothetical protein